jgi:hypothetical protein
MTLSDLENLKVTSPVQSGVATKPSTDSFWKGSTPTERLALRALEKGPLTVNQLKRETGSSGVTVRHAIRCLLLSDIIQELTDEGTAPGDRTYGLMTLEGLIR